MKHITQKILTLAGLLLALSFIPQVHAANNCPGATVTTAGINFNNYNPVLGAGAAVTSTATIVITCGGSGTGPIISIQISAGDSGVFSQRFMKDTSNLGNTLNYNLYVDSTYASTSIWGDGTSGTQDPGGNTNGTHGANTLTVTVYGQIPANQDPYAGCTVTGCGYSDTTVSITINF